jgi:hypothetical protein
MPDEWQQWQQKVPVYIFRGAYRGGLNIHRIGVCLKKGLLQLLHLVMMYV